MPRQQDISTWRTRFVGALLCATLLAVTLITGSAVAPSASAQGDFQTLVVWDRANGVVDNPKLWKFAQSDTARNDIGTATAADPAFDDSSWTDETLRWELIPGPNVANHFRKEFTLEEIGVEFFQIQRIQVGLQYDDSAVLYLNGVEVYRSIRGNLDPDYALYPVGADIPFDVAIDHGGAEQFYVQIPDLAGVNECEAFPGCTLSPYGGPQPPAIPVDLLNPNGVNTWAVTTWNQSGGGSGDSTLDHTFELVIDADAVEPVAINEVMASNDEAYGVQLDDDPELEFPDWFELHNRDLAPVNLAGWTIQDNSDAESWQFPSTVIPAGGYLVVAANDKDRTDGELLQTNFKLSSGGDTLKLVNADGLVVDEYEVIPDQFTDTSYGRPNDNDRSPTYLNRSTPGQSNSGAGNDFEPVLRPFANRMYNQGETVSHEVDAFDPDGDALTFSLTPAPPGISIDNTGLISGTATQVGSFTSTLRVTDTDGRSDAQVVTWLVIGAVDGSPPIVLNEYNAVPGDEEFVSGGPVGNGGDWYEFIVVEDGLDLRGFTFELFDRNGDDDQLRLASTVTFSNNLRLAHAPAGTFITISENMPDDLGFQGDGDWHINFQITNSATGTFFQPSIPSAVFNSSRSGQTVLIKNAQGQVVTPLAGETDAWDSANGNVSSSEVMSLCRNPRADMILDPVADYHDNGHETTFGTRNRCSFTDADGNQTIFNQNLNALRTTTTFGAGSGDVNCDGRLDIADALLAAQFSVGARVDSGPCFFDLGGPGHEVYAGAADINLSGVADIGDALIIGQCSVGVELPWCPR